MSQPQQNKPEDPANSHGIPKGMPAANESDFAGSHVSRLADKKKIEDYTPTEMSALIDSCAYTESRQKEMYYGTAFMKEVLKRDGVPGVIAFVKDFSSMIGEDGKPLPYDFEGNGYKETLSILNRTKLKPNRRDFLRTSAWIIGGYGTLGGASAQALYGGVKTGFEARDIYKDMTAQPAANDPNAKGAGSKEPAPQPPPPDTRTPMQRIDAMLDKYALGPALLVSAVTTELPIGLALIAEGKENTQEIKREQVANVVKALARKMGFVAVSPSQSL